MEMSTRRTSLAKPDNSIYRQPQRMSKRKPAKYNDDESYTTGDFLAVHRRAGRQDGMLSILLWHSSSILSDILPAEVHVMLDRGNTLSQPYLIMGHAEGQTRSGVSSRGRSTKPRRYPGSADSDDDVSNGTNKRRKHHNPW